MARDQRLQIRSMQNFQKRMVALRRQHRPGLEMSQDAKGRPRPSQCLEKSLIMEVNLSVVQ